MAPLFPLLALPELNTSISLAPSKPALMLRMVTMPLLVAMPSPLAKLTAPPVSTVLRPANACSEPPAPLVPLPKAYGEQQNSTAPVTPVLPVLALPEAPTSPALMLRMVIMPLLVVVPSPLAKLNAPPVCTALQPANA